MKKEKRVFIETYQPPETTVAFVTERVKPFLKFWATSGYDLQTLAMSMYLQGMEDLIKVKKIIN